MSEKITDRLKRIIEALEKGAVNLEGGRVAVPRHYFNDSLWQLGRAIKDAEEQYPSFVLFQVSPKRYQVLKLTAAEKGGWMTLPRHWRAEAVCPPAEYQDACDCLRAQKIEVPEKAAPQVRTTLEVATRALEVWNAMSPSEKLGVGLGQFEAALPPILERDGYVFTEVAQAIWKLAVVGLGSLKPGEWFVSEEVETVTGHDKWVVLDCAHPETSLSCACPLAGQVLCLGVERGVRKIPSPYRQE